MPVLPATIWFLIALVSLAVTIMLVEGVLYIRAANALYFYVRQRLPQQWRDMPMQVNDPHEMVFPPDARLAAIVEGIRGLKTDDANYKRLLRISRIHIAIFGVAFLAGITALAILLRMPASCCTWGVFTS